MNLLAFQNVMQSMVAWCPLSTYSQLQIALYRSYYKVIHSVTFNYLWYFLIHCYTRRLAVRFLSVMMLLDNLDAIMINLI